LFLRNHPAFLLVVDTCVLQPPIATLGETSSASQVFSKGPLFSVCCCAIRVEPWVCPCANRWHFQLFALEGLIVSYSQGEKNYNYVNSVVVAPVVDHVDLDLHEIKEAKAQRIILDGMKNHLIPHLAQKKTVKKMWDELRNLF
jgi:hypothetical protein